MAARHRGHSAPLYVLIPLGHSALSWLLVTLLATPCHFYFSWPLIELLAFIALQANHHPPASPNLLARQRLTVVLTTRRLSDCLTTSWPIEALFCSFAALCSSSGCSPSQSGLENARGRSWARSPCPKQWLTEHTNTQGLPWPVGFAMPKQCRLNNSRREGRRTVRRTTNREKGAKHRGWHRTIRNALTK